MTAEAVAGFTQGQCLFNFSMLDERAVEVMILYKAKK